MLAPGCAPAGESAGPALPWVGQPAPELVLRRYETGRPFSLRALRGEIVVLHFGGSWCPATRQAAAALAAIRRESGPRGVRVFVVAVRERPGAVRRWLPTSELDGVPVLVDPRGRASEAWIAPGLSEDREPGDALAGLSAVVDRAGVVRHFEAPDPEAGFDAGLTAVRAALGRMLAAPRG